MDGIDISSLVVGNPPRDFDPTYYAQQPSHEFEQLKAASVSGDVERVVELSKSNQLSPDDFIYSLTLAQQNGQVDIATYLLSRGVPIQIFHVENAVKERNYLFLNLFLEYGYNINEPINWATPSPFIRSFDDEKLCKWLLEHGADPNAQSVLDITPLSVAVQEASFSIIKLLFEYGGSIEHGQLLHYAIRRVRADYLEVLVFILDKGPHVNQVMYENRPACYELQKPFGIGTPLHEAADMGRLDVVDVLLARGADPNIKDARGELAIERAERNNKVAVVERLRSLG